MLSKEKPPDFNKRYDIVGCYVLFQGKFIMLLRQPNKASGGKWCLPAGKVDAGEDLKAAVLRETKEETGIDLAPGKVAHFGSYYVCHGDFHYGWHMFSTELSYKPEVKINTYEHAEYRWVNKDEAMKLDMVEDQDKSIELFFSTE